MTKLKPRLTLATTVLGDEVLKLHGLKGTEALSEPYRFTVTLITKDDKPVNVAALLGTVVKVTLDQESTGDSSIVHPKRYFNGYVTEVSQRVLSNAKWLCTVELRPWLWLLSKIQDCRIFQGKTTPEIVKQVFTDRGFADFELRLSETYQSREFCVQYRETDLAFVSRLLEHEGIYYYFEFDEQKHKLIITDDPAQHKPKTKYETIECGARYIKAPTVESFGGRIYDWSPKQALRAEKCVLKDYDFVRPTVKVEASADGEAVLKEASLEKFDYPGGFTEEQVAKNYVKARIEEERAHAELRTGRTTSHGLTPGYVFTMTKNKDATQNLQYLTVRTEFELAVSSYEANGELSEPGGELETKPWDCVFTALEAPIQFRPARVTPRPVIAGLQTAKVAGGSAEEILTDEYGRIKVQFHWHREGKSDAASSCFIRTAQMWAGPTWGSQHIPRIGHEVVVSFLEGDPDRPLIVGSVYNGLNQPPFKLPEQKEVSGVKSKSTLNGGTGYNELSFDDTKGKEVINLHAQYNMRTVVENERYTKVGGDDSEEVTGKQNIAVGEQHVSVDQNYVLHSKLSIEFVCGASIIKITPLGISISAPKMDITAPIFSVVSTGLAVITPKLNTLPVGPLLTFVPTPPPIESRVDAVEDNIGGKRA